MPHPAPSPCPSPNGPLHWEPAVSQLRDLNADELHAVVVPWLSALDLAPVRLCTREARCTTYQVLLGERSFCLPLHVRIYQRKNRLQAHHVEAFIGYLVHSGIPAGVLITTGDCSREARQLASELTSPRIRILSGNEWAAELAAQKVGLRQRGLWRWIVDVTGSQPGARGRRSQ